MTVEVLGVGGSVGVLVDDPACGRLLLDCGVGVLAAAALRDVPLAGVTRVLTTARRPDRLDPALVGMVAVAGPGDTAAGAWQLDAGGGEVAWLLPTSRGTLLHCPGPGPLRPAVDQPVIPTVPLAPAVAAGLGDRLADPPGARLLVTGGSRSGKSELAERMLAGRDDVTYVATGPVPGPDDQEWADRVRRHRDRRPAGWRTAESQDLAGLLRGAGGPLLVDGVGTWLTAAMDAAGTWEGRGDGELARRRHELTAAWARTRRPVVAVTDEVGSGVVPATSSGRRFRDELGRLNADLAASSDEVWLVAAGIGRRLR